MAKFLRKDYSMTDGKNNYDKQKINMRTLREEVLALVIITVIQTIGIVVLSLNLLLEMFYNYNFLHSELDSLTFQIFDYFFDIPVYELGFASFICLGFAKYGSRPYKNLRKKQYRENSKRKFMPAWIDICGFTVIILSFVSWMDSPV